MIPSLRAARSLDEALSQALEDLDAGFTPLQVLDRYPQYEDELAPLLETANRLRTTRWPTLSLAARVAGRERMHAALTEQRRQRRSILSPVWLQVGAGLALVLLAGTTYFASPVSPLRSMNRSRLTATIPVAATATWPVALSPTVQPQITVLAVTTALPSPAAHSTAEPTETYEREWRHTDTPRPATATPRPTATRTSTATPTRTATPTSTQLATATPAAESGSAPPATVAAPPAASTSMPTTAPNPTHPAAPTSTPRPQLPVLTRTPQNPGPLPTIDAPTPVRTRRATTPEPTQGIGLTPSPESAAMQVGEPVAGVSAPGSDKPTLGQELRDLRTLLQDLRRGLTSGLRGARP